MENSAHGGENSRIFYIIGVCLYTSRVISVSKIDLAIVVTSIAEEVPLVQHTILVIDDQWSMQELARIVLGSAGYRVLMASDAVTGLCLARTEHPDIAVVDDMIAQKNGSVLLDDLHHDPKTTDIPVILISSQAGNALPVPMIDTAPMSNLTKPFRPPELLLMVDTMLHRKEMPIAV